MDKGQSVTLTRLVKAMCPAQQIDEYTPDAWYEAGLQNLSYDDAKAAVMTLATQIRFIALSDIVGEVKRVRKARIFAAGPEILGGGVDANDVAGYLDKVRADVKALGDGVPAEEVESAAPVGAVLQSLTQTRQIASRNETADTR